ncbi:MAG: U32 family peptidase [Armatimonadota bacterium]
MAAELLAPAGTLERLKWACIYGADAVYFGLEDFSLRSYAGNFTMEDAQEGIDFLHKHNKKGYATLNIYPFSNEYDKLLASAKKLSDIGVDGFIVSDLGVIFELKKLGLKTPIHISTQANTVSSQSVLAYAELGAKRVNLARELSLEQIRDIVNSVGDKVELEVFIHGAVCFSYSGRCAISDYLTGRRANRGECTQPCRWKYYLMEETRPGEYFPVEEDNRGLYFFNSRDIALFPYVKELSDMGVASLKIEGRMKNIHYLATVLTVYRRFLDGKPMDEEEALRQLLRVNNRGYTHGFMKGNITPDDYRWEAGTFLHTSVMAANTTEQIIDNHRVCEVKNTVAAGEKLEALTPDGNMFEYILPNPIKLIDGSEAEKVNNQDTFLIENNLPAYTILRKLL